MKLLMAALLAATTPAQPKTQFDLVCTGAGNPQHKEIFEPADIHFRIDLAAKHWCQGDCKAIHDIAELQPSQIWFEKESEAEQEQHLMHWSTVDRETGSYASIHQFFILNHRDTIAQDSHCEPAPFSGFPKIETKF